MFLLFYKYVTSPSYRRHSSVFDRDLALNLQLVAASRVTDDHKTSVRILGRPHTPTADSSGSVTPRLENAKHRNTPIPRSFYRPRPRSAGPQKPSLEPNTFRPANAVHAAPHEAARRRSKSPKTQTQPTTTEPSFICVYLRSFVLKQVCFKEISCTNEPTTIELSLTTRRANSLSPRT